MERSKVTGAIGGGLSGASAGMAFGVPGAVIGGALGLATGFLGGGGENRAMNLARQQADLYKLETKENVRRIDYEGQMTTGLATGLVGASNLQNLYSPASYLDSLESTYISDMAYESLAGSLRERMAMNAGQAAASTIRAAGVSSLLSGVSQAATTFGPGVMEMLKTKPTLGNVKGWEDAARST